LGKLDAEAGCPGIRLISGDINGCSNDGPGTETDVSFSGPVGAPESDTCGYAGFPLPCCVGIKASGLSDRKDRPPVAGMEAGLAVHSASKLAPEKAVGCCDALCAGITKLGRLDAASGASELLGVEVSGGTVTSEEEGSIPSIVEDENDGRALDFRKSDGSNEMVAISRFVGSGVILALGRSEGHGSSSELGRFEVDDEVGAIDDGSVVRDTGGTGLGLDSGSGPCGVASSKGLGTKGLGTKETCMLG